MQRHESWDCISTAEKGYLELWEKTHVCKVSLKTIMPIISARDRGLFDTKKPRFKHTYTSVGIGGIYETTCEKCGETCEYAESEKW